MRFLNADGKSEFEFRFEPVHKFLRMRPGYAECTNCDWAMFGDESKKIDGQYTDQQVLINTYIEHVKTHGVTK